MAQSSFAEQYSGKLTSAGKAAKLVASGDYVVVPSGVGEPPAPLSVIQGAEAGGAEVGRRFIACSRTEALMLPPRRSGGLSWSAASRPNARAERATGRVARRSPGTEPGAPSRRA